MRVGERVVRTIGVVDLCVRERVVPEFMMVKAIGGDSWPAGDVDLLGHRF